MCHAEPYHIIDSGPKLEGDAPRIISKFSRGKITYSRMHNVGENMKKSAILNVFGASKLEKSTLFFNFSIFFKKVDF